LIAANPDRYKLKGQLAGAVLLDSAVYNVPAIMKSKPRPLYVNAFGQDQDFWLKTSPIHNLGQRPTDMILICSAQRETSVCQGAQEFVLTIANRGAYSDLVTVPLSHSKINTDLGLDNEMTRRVDQFIARQFSQKP